MLDAVWPALCAREQAAVEALEASVHTRVEVAEPAIELVFHAGQALVEDAPQKQGEPAEAGDEEDGKECGRHGPQNE